MYPAEILMPSYTLLVYKYFLRSSYTMLNIVPIHADEIGALEYDRFQVVCTEFRIRRFPILVTIAIIPENSLLQELRFNTLIITFIVIPPKYLLLK